ncbi:hypothetical protein [Perlucidibaca piscinae]|uniref:hypothetical protein n=1 Tax=Perlucidibaca piscinae TaxID=392589 RepID=UPI0003B66BA3|nr:hypothetical protein [Perlucidibaca piscinae]
MTDHPRAQQALHALDTCEFRLHELAQALIAVSRLADRAATVRAPELSGEELGSLMSVLGQTLQARAQELALIADELRRRA